MYVLFTSKQMRGRKCMQLHQKCSKITAIVPNTQIMILLQRKYHFREFLFLNFNFFVRFVSLCIFIFHGVLPQIQTNQFHSYDYLTWHCVSVIVVALRSGFVFLIFSLLLLFILILLFVNYNVLFSTFVLPRKIIIVSFK